MSWRVAIDGPSDVELGAIELEREVLEAELRLVDAEARLATRPCSRAVAGYLRALLDVVDLYDLTGHSQAVDVVTVEALGMAM